MNTNDVKEAKIKIVNLIKNKGPSLPVHVAKEINSNLIFTGAFLSEMLADKVLKLSHLRVGGTPLYMMQGQEAMLENFYTSLNNKEKEAYILLKEKGILEDEAQQPAIRVALRAIKDFAIPFKYDTKLYWRYLTFSEEQVRVKLGEPKEVKEEVKKAEKVEERREEKKAGEREEVKHHKAEQESIAPLSPAIKEVAIINTKPKVQELGIFELEKDKGPKKPKTEFIEEIKISLKTKGIEIMHIEKADKKEIIIRAKRHEKEMLIFAFNKKKISDKELVKVYKKALSYNLPYTIIIREDISKKMKENIEASRALLGIEKL